MVLEPPFLGVILVASTTKNLRNTHLFFVVSGPHIAVLRDDSTLFVQESFPVMLGEAYEVLGSNPGGLMQRKYLTYCTMSPAPKNTLFQAQVLNCRPSLGLNVAGSRS